MCYAIDPASRKEVVELFDAIYDNAVRNDEWEEHFHHISAFVHPKLPVMTSKEPKRVQGYNWGLIPKWVKDEKQAKEMAVNTINARSETIFEKPSFRNSIKDKRCLIFANGFYDYREVNKKKYPYYISLKDQKTFAFGGIYDEWTNPETGEIFNTFSMVTTEANPLMAHIHNVKKRMPLILDKDSMLDWIKPDLDKDQITALMKPLDENNMQAHTISKLITSRTERTDVPEVKKEFVYSELSELF